MGINYALIAFFWYVMARQSLVHQALLCTCPICLARIQKHSFLLLWPKRKSLTLIRMEAHVDLGLSVYIRNILSHSTVYYDRKKIHKTPKSKIQIYCPLPVELSKALSYPTPGSAVCLRLSLFRLYSCSDIMHVVHICTFCSKYR